MRLQIIQKQGHDYRPSYNFTPPVYMLSRRVSAHGISKRTTTSTGSKDITFQSRLNSSLSSTTFGRTVTSGLYSLEIKLGGALPGDLRGLNYSLVTSPESMVLSRTRAYSNIYFTPIDCLEAFIDFQDPSHTSQNREEDLTISYQGNARRPSDFRLARRCAEH